MKINVKVSGPPGSGKTVFLDWLEAVIEDRGLKVEKIPELMTEEYTLTIEGDFALLEE